MADHLGHVTVHETEGLRRRAEPVRVGVPLPRGRVREPGHLGLRDPGGRALPVQVQVLDRWSDGSLRWALLDFLADAEPESATMFQVVPAPAEGSPRPSPEVRVTRTGSGTLVDTGVARFVLERGDAFPFRSAIADGLERLTDAPTLEAVDADGRRLTTRIESVDVEDQGPVRATVLLTAVLAGADGATPLRVTARARFHAGSATSLVDVAVHNPRAAQHPGGIWELGDAGSVVLRELRFRVPVRGADRTAFSLEPSAPLADAPRGDVRVFQGGSGGENWQSPVHRAADGSVPVPLRGYRVHVGDVERTGLRATPRIALHDGTGGISVSLHPFWPEFPKAIGSADGALTVDLFPADGDARHEIQGGERKTHSLAIAFGAAALSEGPDAFRAPLLAHPDVAMFVESGAIPHLVARADDPHGEYVRLVDQAIDGDDTFAAKRERIDEYGWRNFGDLWADHEAVGHSGSDPFVSHFNNQYDPVYGAFVQLARSGDVRWLRMMRELARHVADIDVYHTTLDRAAYSGGMFWHTAHYVDAGRSTHRSYPAGTVGGGPDNEHDYATGLLHAHYLTGDPAFRDAVLELADWVIRRDDGSTTPFRFLDRGPTGLASKTRDPDFHGPGRGAGNSIQTLLDAWRIGREERHLAKASEILRRTVHPKDRPDELDLLDAENRWSYTVHLQALVRWLETMAEADRLDEDYAWARESLLTYVRWMVVHERPSLEQPDRLEYPTETWAAQDIRKTEVLLAASLFARDDAERIRFRERAFFFLEESVRTLDSFATKSCTRPVALLMRYGWMAAAFRGDVAPALPFGPADADFGPPAVFVPQRRRAIRRLVRLMIVGAAIGIVAIISLLRSLA